MQKITPFLWFNGNAEEAVQHYTAIFNGNIINTMRAPGNGPVLSLTFELQGQRLIALNGGPQFSFTPAISLFVECDTQDEVDRYWEKLSADPLSEQCGWLKDKFGLSWQIIPKTLGELLGDPDQKKSKQVLDAVLQMKKIDIAKLKDAYNS